MYNLSSDICGAAVFRTRSVHRHDRYLAISHVLEIKMVLYSAEWLSFKLQGSPATVWSTKNGHGRCRVVLSAAARTSGIFCIKISFQRSQSLLGLLWYGFVLSSTKQTILQCLPSVVVLRVWRQMTSPARIWAAMTTGWLAGWLGW